MSMKSDCQFRTIIAASTSRRAQSLTSEEAKQEVNKGVKSVEEIFPVLFKDITSTLLEVPKMTVLESGWLTPRLNLPAQT